MSTRNISCGYRQPVREADNLTTFMCRMSWKSGSLNLLEPSETHWACYRTALPFRFIYCLLMTIFRSSSDYTVPIKTVAPNIRYTGHVVRCTK